MLQEAEARLHEWKTLHDLKTFSSSDKVIGAMLGLLPDQLTQDNCCPQLLEVTPLKPGLGMMGTL